MKRNWLQVATLILCAALLGLNLWQGRQIEALRQEMWNAQKGILNDFNSMRQQVTGLSARIAEGEKLVRDWELAPTGMDKETNSLLTEVSLNLKEWRADTEVWLTARQGSNTNIVYLKDTGTGRFSGSLPVSLAGETLSLEVRVDGGGTSRQEELGGWDDVSMLLPVQISGSGYGEPTYRNGVFSVDDYSVNLTDRNYEPAAVKEPAFYLQRNGETVWEAEGVPRMDAWAASGLSMEEAREAGLAVEGSYSIDGPAEAECQPGDAMALFFTCRDEYGLKYTFPLESWQVDGDGRMPVTAPGSSPALSWD